MNDEPSTSGAPDTVPTERDLRAVVDAFYGTVRLDPLLGPLFARVEHWELHLERINAFWSSVVLGSGRYKGNPFAAHLPLRGLVERAHFERWLTLWSRAARTVAPIHADLLEAKANRIADSLLAGLLFKTGEPSRSAIPSPAIGPNLQSGDPLHVNATE